MKTFHEIKIPHLEFFSLNAYILKIVILPLKKQIYNTPIVIELKTY